jgi:hypothetical protein
MCVELNWLRFATDISEDTRLAVQLGIPAPAASIGIDSMAQRSRHKLSLRTRAQLLGEGDEAPGYCELQETLHAQATHSDAYPCGNAHVCINSGMG